MTTLDGNPLREVLTAGFFEHHWRTSPCILPGAAQAFLPTLPTLDDFEAWTETRHGEGGPVLKTDERTVFFLDSLQAPLVQPMLTHATGIFAQVEIGAASVRTIGSSSIGPHFDNTDNFVVQVTGSKRWELVDSDRLPDDIKRRRLRQEPGLGALRKMVSDAQMFELGPGDVLYIPLLWPHWGVSHGDSLSVSLAITASPNEAVT